MSNQTTNGGNHAAALFKYGPWGILAAAFIYFGPTFIDGYKVNREQGREDQIVSSQAWEGYAKRLEAKLEELDNRVAELTALVNDLTRENNERAAADANAPVGIIWLDEKLDLIEMNQAAFFLWLKPTGLKREDVMGKNWPEMFPGNPQAKRYHEHDKEIRRTREPRFDKGGFTIMESGDRVDWVMVKWPIIKSGEFRGIKAIFYPLSAYKVPEDDN